MRNMRTHYLGRWGITGNNNGTRDMLRAPVGVSICPQPVLARPFEHIKLKNQLLRSRYRYGDEEMDPDKSSTPPPV